MANNRELEEWRNGMMENRKMEDWEQTLRVVEDPRRVNDKNRKMENCGMGNGNSDLGILANRSFMAIWKWRNHRELAFRPSIRNWGMGDCIQNGGVRYSIGHCGILAFRHFSHCGILGSTDKACLVSILPKMPPLRPPCRPAHSPPQSIRRHHHHQSPNIQFQYNHQIAAQ